MQVVFKDGVSSRQRRHKNLILCPNLGVIEFRNGNPALLISEVGGAPRWGYWTK